MNFAILGCGYVADFYMATLADYPELQITGAFDSDPERLGAFNSYHGAKPYPEFDALLNDEDVKLVLNLAILAANVHLGVPLRMQ